MPGIDRATRLHPAIRDRTCDGDVLVTVCTTPVAA
jgi:hypothetical protein